jgi:predicted dienelactone hydrolase
MNRMLSTLRVRGAALVLLVLGGAIVPPVTAQVDNRLPAPTGPYQVGVTSRQWEDTSRGEIYTADPDDHHMVTVWIWYPADVEEGAEPASYLENPGSYWAIGDLAKRLGTTRPAVMDYVSTLHVSAYQDAPVAAAEARYPVVVYFDPLSGLPINQGVQVQDLASHGYIVVSILHAYGFNVQFGDQLYIGDAKFSYSFTDWTVNALPDVSFTIDQLTTLNADEQFAERLDLDNIGLSGYSLGGNIAAMATAEDERIKAAISQDGLPVSFDYSRIEQPYLLFQAEEDFADEFGQFGGPTYLVASDRLLHMSFSDAIFWPNHLDMSAGIVDGGRGTHIIDAYVIAFFDRYLKGEAAPLLDGPSPDYPEVDFEMRNISG